MYTALFCIRTGTIFDFSRLESLDSSLETIIGGIMKTPHPYGSKFFNDDGHSSERCRLWETALGPDQVLGRTCDRPKPYDEDAWTHEITQHQKPVQNSDYYWFNLAANIHREYVEDQLYRSGIDLSTPDLSCMADTSEIKNRNPAIQLE